MRSFVPFRRCSFFWSGVFAVAVWGAIGPDTLAGRITDVGDVRLELSKVAAASAGAGLELLPRVWQTDEGLPNNRVQAIAQTPEGYLWVGTQEGLARFDGAEFKTFDDFDRAKIRSASITALCLAMDGTLWIGTDQGEVVRWHDGRFSALPIEEWPSGRSIRAICQGRNGEIWIASAGGLYRMRDGHTQSYTKNQGLLSDDVATLCEDNDGNMWIGTKKGLNCLRAGKMEAFANINGFTNEPVRSIWQDRERRVWICSNHGLVAYKATGSGHNRPVSISSDNGV